MSLKIRFCISLFIIVLLFGCKSDLSTLPKFNFKTFSKIEFDKSQLVEIDYTYNGESAKLVGEIKARGGYSRKFDKRSYSLELKENGSLGGLPADDDWILNASYIDKTLMRHKLNYDLFAQLSPFYVAPKSTFAYVSANGKPQGIYVLMEKITPAMVGIDKKDHAALLWKEPPIFYKDLLKTPQEPDNYYQQRWPKIKSIDKAPYLNSLKKILQEGDDSIFLAKIKEDFNIENVIDWHLMLLLSNNSDGLLKNFYLYRRSGSEKLCFALWDYDHSFGRDGDNELNLIERTLNIHKNILLKRLLTAEGSQYKTKLKVRYQELRSKGIFSEKNINNMIESYEDQLREHIRHNESIWPYNSNLHISK